MINLLQDIRTKSGINQLQEELKQEFDLFLNASFNHTSFDNKKPSWNFLTLGGFNPDENESVKNSETKDISVENKQVALTNQVAVVNKQTKKKPIKAIEAKNDNSKTNKKTEIISNMQVALIENKDNSKNPI